MTWTLTSSPTRCAAALPASVAALTAPTSPATITVTRPPPMLCLPISSTFAALTIASAASIAPTNPFVSTRPNASPLAIVVSPILYLYVYFCLLTRALGRCTGGVAVAGLLGAAGGQPFIAPGGVAVEAAH